MAQLFGCCRVVANDFIAANRNNHRAGRPYQSAYALQAELLTQAKKKPERAWLGDVAYEALKQSLRDADTGYRNFFNSTKGKRAGKKLGAPKFKSKHGKQSARFVGKIKVRTNAKVGFVYLPKIGWVRFNLSRALPSTPSSVTLIRKPDGRFFVSFVVGVPTSDSPPKYDRVAALDVGVSSTAIVYSDGTREKLTPPKPLKRRLKKLRRMQKSLARKQRGSNARTKQRIKVARLHARVADIRTNHNHKTTSRLVGENQTICLEALNISDLISQVGVKGRAGRHIRRAYADVGLGQFLTLLKAKAREHGRDIVAVNPAGTTTTCSVCGGSNPRLPLTKRVWGCEGCGSHLDRDYNAAVNILVAAGQAETLNAGGADVRLGLAQAVGVETRTHRTELRLVA